MYEPQEEDAAVLEARVVEEGADVESKRYPALTLLSYPALNLLS